MDDLLTKLREHEALFSTLIHGPLCGRAADEIEHLRKCHRIVARQVGFYKPELPDYHKVEIHLGVLRAAERCAGQAPWEVDDAHSRPLRKEETKP